MRPHMLIAYDGGGEVVGTLDYLVRYAPDGSALGLVDFAAHEEAGGELTEIWSCEGATGSHTWPEWLGSATAQFRVELVGPPGNKRIRALVHKVSGHRRERATVESAISARIAKAKGQPADIRDLVGGPGRALPLASDGRNAVVPS